MNSYRVSAKTPIKGGEKGSLLPFFFALDDSLPSLPPRDDDDDRFDDDEDRLGEEDEAWREFPLEVVVVVEVVEVVLPSETGMRKSV